jgi:hypothetical protein
MHSGLMRTARGSTSLCTFLPISTNRRQTFSRNETTLSTSASLGSSSSGPDLCTFEFEFRPIAADDSGATAKINRNGGGIRDSHRLE